SKMSMNSRFTLGAAAALLVSGIAGRATAQGQVVVPARPRDSVTVRIAPTPALLDSIKLLFRALQTEPNGSATWEMLKKQIDALGFALMPSRMAFEQGLSSRESVMPKGYIGIVAPGRMLVSSAGQVVEYFDYPSIVSVDPDSPAQRAGIVPGDLLLAYDGLDV